MPVGVYILVYFILLLYRVLLHVLERTVQNKQHLFRTVTTETSDTDREDKGNETKQLTFIHYTK